jgi:peptidoglycan/LPS O-acetylase OafA/YrhL
MGGTPSISTLVGSSKFTFVPLIRSFTNGRGKNHGIHTELGYTESLYDGVGVVVVVVVLTGVMLVVVVVFGGTEDVVVGGRAVVVVVAGVILVVVVVAGSTEVVLDVC